MNNLLYELGLSSSEATAATGALLAMLAVYVVLFLIAAFYIVVWCVIYHRADVPVIARFVPFWSEWCYFKIVYGHGWLSLIPGVNLFLGLAAPFLLARVFGRDVGFGIGLFFLPWIFLPMLAFSTESQYSGPIFD